MSFQLPTDTREVQRIIRALEAREAHKFLRFKPYPWQTTCYAAGANHKQRLVVAGNRVGKTLGLVYEVAAHATGEYPDWWEGLEFKFAPTIWCCGVSGEQMRDVLQRVLLGDMDEKGAFSGGMIHPSKIKSVVRDSGTPRLAKDIRVKHKLGGTTLLSFKSYTQGPKPLMGANVDFAFIDEQPPDDAYNQVLTRTTLGNRGTGGSLLVGFTPELGLTNVLQEWMQDPKPGQFKQQITWDDSPHLTEDLKKQMLEATSEDERDLRSKGLPIFGGGPVFSVQPDDYVMPAREVPPWWRVNCAIDFGMSHKFACVWTATNPETGEIWVFDEYATSNSLPPVHIAAIQQRGKRIPIVYPHDGHIREKSSGITLADNYRRMGGNLVQQFTNPDGSLFILPGLQKWNLGLATGKIKIFDTCRMLRNEMLVYHKDEKGNPIAVKDDVIDAARYAIIMADRIGIDYADAHEKPFSYTTKFGESRTVDY